jgi:hypothetical protein
MLRESIGYVIAVAGKISLITYPLHPNFVVLQIVLNAVSYP